LWKNKIRNILVKEKTCVVVDSKFHKLVSTCYSCSLALTPYVTLMCLINVFKKCNEKKKKKELEHDKKENNLTITPKLKT
jgi:hypothetical protein